MTDQDRAREGPRTDHAREFLRDHEGERVRQLKGNLNLNPFHIPQEWLDQYPGIRFEWKNYEIMGQPDYRQRQFEEMQGWRAVPHSMFPGKYAPVGTQGYIIVKDQVLMERPEHLCVEARQEEIDRANLNLRINQQMAAQPTNLGPKFNPNGEFVTKGRNPVNLSIPDD